MRLSVALLPLASLALLAVSASAQLAETMKKHEYYERPPGYYQPGYGRPPPGHYEPPEHPGYNGGYEDANDINDFSNGNLPSRIQFRLVGLPAECNEYCDPCEAACLNPCSQCSQPKTPGAADKKQDQTADKIEVSLPRINTYDVYVESSTTLTEGGGRPGEADYLDHVGQIDVLKVYQPRARPARLFDQIGYGVGYVDDFVWRGAGDFPFENDKSNRTSGARKPSPSNTNPIAARLFDQDAGIASLNMGVFQVLAKLDPSPYGLVPLTDILQQYDTINIINKKPGAVTVKTASEEGGANGDKQSVDVSRQNQNTLCNIFELVYGTIAFYLPESDVYYEGAVRAVTDVVQSFEGFRQQSAAASVLKATPARQQDGPDIPTAYYAATLMCPKAMPFARFTWEFDLFRVTDEQFNSKVDRASAKVGRNATEAAEFKNRVIQQLKKNAKKSSKKPAA